MTNKQTTGNDIQLVRKLADILDRENLTEIAYENEQFKVKLTRSVMVATPPVMPQAPMPATASFMPPAPGGVIQSAAETASAPSNAEVAGVAVPSPMVGTVYLSPAPDKPTFVSVGAKVKKGDILLIIEAMKTFNEVYAPTDGTIAEILVENQSPVEFDQPLIRLT